MRATLTWHMHEVKQLYSKLDEIFYHIIKMKPEVEVNHRALRELCVILMKPLNMKANKVDIGGNPTPDTQCGLFSISLCVGWSEK